MATAHLGGNMNSKASSQNFLTSDPSKGSNEIFLIRKKIKDFLIKLCIAKNIQIHLKLLKLKHSMNNT